jgi:hypothetical protein
MRKESIAQFIIDCIYENIEKNNFELRDEDWYEINCAFKFDTKDGKIKHLDVDNIKIVKSAVRNRKH